MTPPPTGVHQVDPTPAQTNTIKKVVAEDKANRNWFTWPLAVLALAILLLTTALGLTVHHVITSDVLLNQQRDELTTLLGKETTTNAQGVASNTGLIGALQAKDAAATMDRAALHALIAALQSQEAALAARAPVPGPRGATGATGARGAPGISIVGPPGPSGKPAPTPTPKPTPKP